MRRTCWLWLAFVLTYGTHTTRARQPSSGPPERSEGRNEQVALTMTPAVACLAIDGQGQYEPLPEAALTSEEKLLVYYRPLNFHVEHTGSTYHVHLVQDGQVRPRGSRRALQTKPRMIDEEWKGKEPPGSPYIRSLVSLKGFTPGEYEFEITLHDLLAPGRPTARQTLPFTIIPAGPRKGKDAR
jgi:hypothetical protein